LLVATALNGSAVAMVLDDMVAPLLEQGRLQRVLEDWCPPFSGYHIYYPNRQYHSPAFEALLAELRLP
jgi:DNA-binding transcriptional LysR family regulator